MACSENRCQVSDRGDVTSVSVRDVVNGTRWSADDEVMRSSQNDKI